MLRKMMIALFACASVAVLAPDAALARGGFGGGGGGFHGGGGGGFRGGGGGFRGDREGGGFRGDREGGGPRRDREGGPRPPRDTDTAPPSDSGERS
jgi:hypothetical protein